MRDFKITVMGSGSFRATFTFNFLNYSDSGEFLMFDPISEDSEVKKMTIDGCVPAEGS